MAIKLQQETEQRLLASIKRFFAEEMEEEVGDLRARLILDYCLKEVGPSVYNQAIADAQAQMQEKVADLDGTCYETEFTYFDKKKE